MVGIQLMTRLATYWLSLALPLLALDNSLAVANPGDRKWEFNDINTPLIAAPVIAQKDGTISIRFLTVKRAPIKVKSARFYGIKSQSSMVIENFNPMFMT